MVAGSCPCFSTGIVWIDPVSPSRAAPSLTSSTPYFPFPHISRSHNQTAPSGRHPPFSCYEPACYLGHATPFSLSLSSAVPPSDEFISAGATAHLRLSRGLYIMESATEYYGSLIALEGASDIISTQLRLLPSSPQILILPSIQQYIEDDRAAEAVFNPRAFVGRSTMLCLPGSRPHCGSSGIPTPPTGNWSS